MEAGHTVMVQSSSNVNRIAWNQALKQGRRSSSL